MPSTHCRPWWLLRWCITFSFYCQIGRRWTVLFSRPPGTAGLWLLARRHFAFSTAKISSGTISTYYSPPFLVSESPPRLGVFRQLGNSLFGIPLSLILRFSFCSISRVAVWLRTLTCPGLRSVISTVPSDGRGRWAVRDFPKTDGTAPRPSVPSLLHNDGMRAGDLLGMVTLPCQAVIHSPRPILGSYSMNLDDIEHSPESAW